MSNYKVIYSGRIEVDTTSLIYSSEGQRAMDDAQKTICASSGHGDSEEQKQEDPKK